MDRFATMGDGGSGAEGKGKGKGKEKADDDRLEHEEDSLLSRITASAATLPSALFSGPPGGAGELARAGNSEKGESSRTAESLSRAGESSVQFRSRPTPTGQVLKSSHTQEQIAREDASFADFLDTTGFLTPPADASGLEEAWLASASAAGPGRINADGAAGQIPPSSIAEQERRDGEAVVALLSANNDPEPDHLLGNEAMSSEDISRLRAALFGPNPDEAVSHIAWDNVLNLIPEYLLSSEREAADPTAMHLGTSNPQEAWQTWIDQWSRVLTAYQDEVWGDLGALVEEARVEVEKLEQETPSEKMPAEPKALLRLRAILGHLRGSQPM
ncbi:hypothetical protein QBC46DRAFT_458012 [Diplogelasinospora grovesii]|uniref:Uncharacterized protein n=1 Tax=Diplogelasinospora grovesii TaxID=303347 RepID=A0AAN6NDP1_9PEZI|nr:hypothetical protein QBC46DRAFT_458012 [Diplogelasinospora grovesii]